MEQNRTIDLELLKRTIDLVERESDPLAEKSRTLLRRISDQLTSHEMSEGGEQTIGDFLRANPGVSASLSEELAEEALAFVTEACEYYYQMKDSRPLTEDEKSLGSELKTLLQSIKSLLHS